eukprot:TRINITY_DN3313_c0_g1_i1.p1 TRINITY_DN3313_c0_g1~~TRINITY_DN3313_c0_g1_i1.p1  ORF type:complete len:979 (+),score=233.47 TRINITY_DN3313_c0_g1_i1:58-2994(+)
MASPAVVREALKSAIGRSAVVPNVMRCVGGTPIVKLNRLAKGLYGDVYTKLEYMQPGKSVKDRTGSALILEGEAKGLLTPGRSTIVEATSGNTGIALAMLGAARGYDVLLTMPETMSLERRINLMVFGAKVILTPAKGGVMAARHMAAEIVQNINKDTATTGRNAYLTHQFDSISNSYVHELHTAPEIHSQLGFCDAFVMGVGTGGTLNGVAEFYKEACGRKGDHLGAKHPMPMFVAVEPEDSPALTKNKLGEPFTPCRHAIEGIGAGFVPSIVNVTNIDEIAQVSSQDAIDTARALAAEEGILCGVSGGANVKVALDLARQPNFKGKKIVCVIPSHGERYLSTPLYSDLRDLATSLEYTAPTTDAKGFPQTRPAVIPAAGGYTQQEPFTLGASIGNTPMMQLNTYVDGLYGTVMLKLENNNPGKTVLDRSAAALLEDAEKAGAIGEGSVVIDACGGDFGASLAMLCASKGYKCILCVPGNESVESKTCIMAYGATLKVTPPDLGMLGAEALATEVAAATPQGVLLGQYQNASRQAVHAETTAPEIDRDTEGKVDFIVVPVKSTGAMLQGIRQYYERRQAQYPNVKVPTLLGARMVGDTRGTLCGFGHTGGDTSSVFDLADEIINVTEHQVKETMLSLPSAEGIFGGRSTAVCVAAAKTLAARPETQGKLIVTLAVDYGDHFFSDPAYSSLKEHCLALPTVPLDGVDHARSAMVPAQPTVPSPSEVWASLVSEATQAAKSEPRLIGYFNSRILQQPNFASAIGDIIAPSFMTQPGVDLCKSAVQCLYLNPHLMADIAHDLWRYGEIDAALQTSDNKFLTPFLMYKGFQAVVCHRIAHHFWTQGEHWMALLLQSSTSHHYSVDIHPQARFGPGVTLDHATGVVIGATSVVGQDVQFLHDVTLGASGKDGAGDRHPKIGDGVVLGAHSQILGNIKLGNNCVVAAAAVVNRDVEPDCTVAGVPAKVVTRRPVLELAYDPQI